MIRPLKNIPHLKQKRNTRPMAPPAMDQLASQSYDVSIEAFPKMYNKFYYKKAQAL